MGKLRGKDFWGPRVWKVVHLFALWANTPHKARAYCNFVRSLGHIAPCEECKFHFTSLLTRLPPEPHTISAKKMFEYSYLLHSAVNKRLKKPDREYASVEAEYKNIVARCNPDEWGRLVWEAVHSLAMGYKSQTSSYFMVALECIAVLMPTFNREFSTLLRQNPVEPYLTNNEDLFFYTYVIHSLANERSGTSKVSFSYIKTRYFNAMFKCESCEPS